MSEGTAVEVLSDSLTGLEIDHPTRSTAPNEYAALKNIIKKRGLLEKQPKYYTYKILLIVGMLVLGIIFFLAVNNFLLRMVDAVFLAFVFGQIGFLGHDAGHRQIFNTTWKNDIVILLQGNLFVGMSYSWWLNKHNEHHSHPNQIDMDPDIAIPAISFTQEDALKRRKFGRLIAKYQAFFLFPLLMLVGIDLQRTSINYLIRTKVKSRWVEIAMMVLHYILYLSMVFFCLNLWQGIVFILVHQMLFGLYLGSTFAPNHKGMPILEKESKMDFLRRQVVTARNVTPSPFNDFWYGGLNYQIEHHLFPSMPRRNLKEAHGIIKAFCQEHDITFYETSVAQSYKEILGYLHSVGAPLRAKRAKQLPARG
jgi:fatty acid desaturase